MGNSQSNTRTENRKTFKIVRKEEHSGWFRCHLDDYVTYKNGSYDRIDFADSWGSKSGAGLIFGALLGETSKLELIKTDVGNYISVDLNMTANYDSGHEFSIFTNFSGIENSWRSQATGSSGSGSFLEANRELIKELEELNQRREFLVEYNRWLAQTEAWTSYNLPPK